MFISSHLRDSNVQGRARRHCRLYWAAQLCLFASFDRWEMIVTDLTIDNCRQNSQPQQPYKLTYKFYSFRIHCPMLLVNTVGFRIENEARTRSN